MKLSEEFRRSLNRGGRRVLRKALVAFLVLIVSAQAASVAWPQDPEITPSEGESPAAASDPAKAELLNIRPGAFVEVRLTDGAKLRGQLGDVAETDFALRTIKNDRMTELRVPYNELRSVRMLARARTRGRGFDTAVRRAQLVMGLVAGGILLGITIYAVSTAR
jgi:hypothetical protein